MTARYELLITSMREASEAVLICFVFAMLMLIIRYAVRRAVDTPHLPDYFKTLMYNVADVLLLLPIYALIIVSA